MPPSKFRGARPFEKAKELLNAALEDEISVSAELREEIEAFLAQFERLRGICLTCWLEHKYGEPYPATHTGLGPYCPVDRWGRNEPSFLSSLNGIDEQVWID